MESCVSFLGVVYFFIQAIVVFFGIGIVCPIVLIKLAVKLELKSFMWFAIAFWIYISTIGRLRPIQNILIFLYITCPR